MSEEVELTKAKMALLVIVLIVIASTVALILGAIDVNTWLQVILVCLAIVGYIVGYQQGFKAGYRLYQEVRGIYESLVKVLEKKK